jgi:protein-tyrosine phosphatase
MIDLHCHILPGVDDGAKTENDSLDMAKAAQAEGITHIVATPHHRNGVYDNTKEEIELQVKLLNQLLESHGIPVTILPGQENRLQGDILEKIEQGEILTMNNTGNYLFVEFPTSHVPRYTSQLFYDLQLAGVIPVIVHPERNNEIFNHPEALYQLINNGALSQVTAGSLIGKFGKKIQKLSFQLIDYSLAHFIASDAHNTSSRGFHLRAAYKAVEEKLGVQTRYLLEENAELLIDGQAVNRDQPEQIREKKFLGIF